MCSQLKIGHCRFHVHRYETQSRYWPRCYSQLHVYPTIQLLFHSRLIWNELDSVCSVCIRGFTIAFKDDISLISFALSKVRDLNSPIWNGRSRSVYLIESVFAGIHPAFDLGVNHLAPIEFNVWFLAQNISFPTCSERVCANFQRKI